jgi:hypothetical protein
MPEKMSEELFPPKPKELDMTCFVKAGVGSVTGCISVSAKGSL